jgi:hypothetical protein
MLANHLSEHGLAPWLDEAELNLGDHLTKTILDALESTEYMAIVISSNSVQSNWVAKEIEMAQLLEKKKKSTIIIPILIEDVTLPPELSDRVYANFTEPKAYHRGFHELLKLLGHHPKFEGDLIIFSDSLRLGWENMSWDCDCDEKCTQLVYKGQYSIRAKLRGFGGLAFAFRSGINTIDYSRLEFFLNGGESGGQRLKVFMNDRPGNGIRRPVSLPPLFPKKWKLFSIHLKDLDAKDILIVKINISNNSNRDAKVFYLDDIRLVQ